MGLVVVVCVVAHRHAVLHVFVLDPVLLARVAVGSRRHSVVRHVFKVVRAAIGPGVVVLVLYVPDEIGVAAVLDHVVFVVQRIVSLQGLDGWVAVGIMVV